MDLGDYDAIDLFSGPGGWDLAARWLGLSVLGIEIDDAACATRRAAGLPTLQADVLALNPRDFHGVRGEIASPPCPTFSAAGSGSGRAQVGSIVRMIEQSSYTDIIQQRWPDYGDPRTALVLEPLRWALILDPEWIALEQVPPVLPIWDAMAKVLCRYGYCVDTGIVTAEQYGVPQTRRRAILVASRVREVGLPAPSHCKYRKGVAQAEGDPSLLPWVSMADALGWGMDARPSMTVTAGGTQTRGGRGLRQRSTERNAAREDNREMAVMRSNYGTGGDPRNRGERRLDEPAPTITSKIGRNKWIE